jgi:hypothetical protein
VPEVDLLQTRKQTLAGRQVYVILLGRLSCKSIESRSNLIAEKERLKVTST